MVIYLDDIPVFGDDPDHVWVETVSVIRCLMEAGFILSVKKQNSWKKRSKCLAFKWLVAS